MPNDLPPTTAVEQTPDLFNFEVVRKKLTRLISNWKNEEDKTCTRRKMRNVEVDIEDLINRGKLKADETIITIRVIDNIIEKEKPPFISFLKQSRRLAIFKCKSKPGLVTENLEQEFSDKMKYSGWELPYFKCLDSAQTHGWAAVEIEFREDRPAMVGVDFIKHEDLIFPLDAKDIQAQEIILRRYEFTPHQLREFAKKFNFETTEVERVLNEEIKNDEQKNVVCYKKYCKYNGVVYVAWFLDPNKANIWLKAPVPLWLGRKRLEQKPIIDEFSGIEIGRMKPTWTIIYESLYPIKLLPYSETEEDKIVDHKGRVFKDISKQEAQTALWSTYINGAVRAGNVYAAPKNDTNGGDRIATIETELESGKIYNRALDLFHTDYPSADLLRATNALDVQTQAETGQVAFSAVNREDSRKTAKEISSAESQQALLSSVEVTLFSTWVREVLNHEWLIVQSLALQGVIEFLLVPSATPDPLTGEIKPVNDIETIGQTYEIFAAGEADVIQRAEKLQRRGQLWPIVANTVAVLGPQFALEFLIDMVKESLPEDAERYESIIRTAAQTQGAVGAIQGVIPIIDAISKDPESAKIHAGELGQVVKSLQTVVQQQSGGQPQEQPKQESQVA